MTIENVTIVIIYLIVQFFSNKIIASSRLGPGKWLSFSGGLALSYVFVYVLPSLHKEQESYGDKVGSLATESELYFIGVLGVVVFYIINKLANNAEKRDSSNEGAFYWIQISFFGLYNMMIAFIVFGSNVEGVEAAYYGIAIGFHYVAISHDLWMEEPKRYEKYGRYVLAAGILAGWVTGVLVPFPQVALAVVFAFISGAIILNVLNRELPTEEDAHLPAFLIGVSTHTIATLALKYFFYW